MEITKFDKDIKESDKRIRIVIIISLIIPLLYLGYLVYNLRNIHIIDAITLNKKIDNYLLLIKQQQNTIDSILLLNNEQKARIKNQVGEIENMLNNIQKNDRIIDSLKTINNTKDEINKKTIDSLYFVNRVMHDRLDSIYKGYDVPFSNDTIRRKVNESITEETITEKRRTIYKTTVKNKGQFTSFTHIIYDWGENVYFKNDNIPITPESYRANINALKRN